MRVYQAQIAMFDKYGIHIYKGDLHTDKEKAKEELREMLEDNERGYPFNHRQGVVAQMWVA